MRILPIISVLLLPFLLMPARVFARRAMDPAVAKIYAIAADPTTDTPTKIADLKKHLDSRKWQAVLYCLDRIDHREALLAAREAFAESDPGRRLALGHMMLLTNSTLKDDGLMDVYGPFLVDAVLREGEKEFMQKREPNRPSFVGEYVSFACDFPGVSPSLFEKIADKRVVPILIACLDAPNYEEGGVLEADEASNLAAGAPGSEKGRNTERQRIPLALAKLGAVEAVPALQKILAEHADWYERFNAAVALGVLLEPEESARLTASMQAHESDHDNRAMLYGLGSGMMRRGNPAGIALMSFRYAPNFGEGGQWDDFHMLHERVDAVTRMSHPSAEAFYREALEHPVLRKQWLADPAGAGPAADFSRIAERVIEQQMRGLAPVFAMYAKQSDDAEVRRASARALAALGGSPVSALSATWLAAFVAVFFGQYMAARALLGWVHSKAMSDKIFPTIAGAAGVIVIAGLLVMLSKVGLHGPRLLRGGEWSEVHWAWRVYIILSIAALLVGVIANVHAETRREPAVQVSKTTRRLDIALLLGRDPSGGGLSGMIARLPGNELFYVDIIERHLRPDALPAEWRGLSIVHLSDLHLRGTPDRTYFEKAAELVNEMSPDMIVLTGDVIDTQKVCDWLATTLGPMRAPLGRYFVLGNHDEHSHPAQTRAELARLGWVDVAGRCARVEHRGSVMEIGGTERPWMGVAPAFSVGDPSEQTFRVLLSHAPDRLPWAAHSGVHLMLAGHLHGGQICLPLLGPMKSGRKIAGVFQEGPTTMHLSRGLGEMMPIRWRCRPEITKIVLD